MMKNEESFRAIFDWINDAIFVHDKETGAILDVNARMCEMYGYTREEAIGLTIEELSAGSSLHTQKDALEKIARASGNEPQIFTWQAKRKDGSLFWCEINMCLARIGDNDRILVVVRDITERKQAADALAKSEKKYRMMTDLLPQSVFEADLNGTLTYVNKSGFELFGYTKEDFEKGINAFSIIVPQDRAVVSKNIQEILEGKPSGGVEYAVLKKDGTSIPVIIYSTVIEGEDKPIGFRGIIIDTTGIKHAEEESIINESKFRAIYDQASHLAGILNVDGILLDVNLIAREYAGKDEASFIGKPFWLTPWWKHSPEIQSQLKSGIEKAVKGEYVQFETTHYNTKGEMRYIDFSIKPVIDKSGKVFCLIPEGRDITERKKAEEALRESEETARALLDATSDAAFLIDTNGIILTLNTHMAQRFGRTVQEMIGSSIYDYFPEDLDKRRHEHIARMIKTGQAIRFEDRNAGMWLENRIYPIFDAKGQVVKLAAFSRDITERKQAEEEREKLQDQLLQARKMESVGRLAGGVAHDFNNMLSVIIGYAEVELNKKETTGMLRRHLEEILNAGRRSAVLTQQLLAFARKQTIAPRVLDLNETVEGMLKMLRRLIGEDIDLGWLPGKRLWKINMDPAQIDQILANLCVNARDAIEGVGSITIETTNVALDKSYCAAHGDFLPGEYVMMAVSDNGCGIDKGTQARIFEPFFTTKGMGQGTGLGLATVYGIVTQNNGFINLYSESGHGTVFKIYIPRHSGESLETDVSPPEEIPRGHGETILIVEDEPSTLEMSRIALQSLGYTVLAAATPGEAIQLAQEQKRMIDLLVTDVVMPGMNGRELAERLREIRPGMPCLFMSGYTANVIAHRGVLYEGVHFIQKPFSIPGLAAKVRAVLSDIR